MARPKEYFFKEGCFIEEWHNNANDMSMSVARVRVEIGKTTNLHSLKCTQERYVLLDGEAVVTVGDEQRSVGPGDVVVIPENIPQRIKNCGNKDLIFLAICTPRFKEQNYQDLQS